MISAVLLLSFCAPNPSEDDLSVWIGQMLMVGFRGAELAKGDEFLDQIAEYGYGGVVLFDFDVESSTPGRNIQSRDQVELLIRTLQSAAVQPLLVAIDQEGGRVARLKPRYGFPETLSQEQLGEVDDEEITRGQAKRTGRLLGELGINLNFSPVLDVAVFPENPVISGLERSYSADPSIVERHGRWTMEEYAAAGILSAVKHFPGHGSSRDDSHSGLPDVTKYWTELELRPFETLIKEGLPDVVMTAHLFNSNWDFEYPATLSERVIRGLLRERLGFEGVVVSDDMGMGSIVKNYSLEAAIERAVLAGVDLLAFGNNSIYDPTIGVKAFHILRDLVRNGQVPRARIKRSHERIQRLKKKAVLIRQSRETER